MNQSILALQLLALVLFIFCSKNQVLGQEPEIQKINWVSFLDAVELNQKEQKKIMVDIYTDWCGWCKKLDATTFAHPEIVRYVNENFYAVKLDGEMKDTLRLGDRVFTFVSNGRRGYHELAAELMQNRMSYPTVVFLDESFNMIQPVPGYQDAPTMEVILNYFGSNSYKNTEWPAFQQNFKARVK